MNNSFRLFGFNGAAPVAILAAGTALLGGCQKNENAGGTPQAIEVSVQKNSFREVTSKLDAGGNLYAYLSTEQWLDGLSGKVEGFREWFKDIPQMSESDREGIDKVITVVSSLIKHCGIEDISGVGMSSIMREKGIYRSRFVVHHYPGRGSGFLWNICGDKSHSLQAMDWLPATTALAAYTDFDLSLLWATIQKEAEVANIPDLTSALKEAPGQFESGTGLKLAEVLASLANEYGLVLTLDDSNKISVPMGGQSKFSMPEPGILFAIKVNNDLIYNRVAELLKENPSVIKTETNGLKMMTMPVPIPVPINLRPSMARSGDYLLIASSDALIQEAVAVKAGKKPGLKSTDEFKRMSHDIPETGNEFAFMSERFGKTITDIQMQAIQVNGGNASLTGLFQRFINLSGPASGFSVAGNGPEGWVTTANGTRNPANIILLPAVIVPAVAAGFIMPAVRRAEPITIPPPSGQKLGTRGNSSDGSR